MSIKMTTTKEMVMNLLRVNKDRECIILLVETIDNLKKELNELKPCK